ncbi:isopenicillin N synthase family oxygenase [Loktanella sp. SALINAS62]|uniref:isopenicillin N synthase family dioxygenase n=1 Tax=Loktanella sp. SALINAS62 TaxID=2706124 RepID=UPI001B8BD49B|nr:isopenicillin N synthase family oxygenase [Loktanella sp. SALINAS62]MBS1301589.1 isopenicillin N synthase family oxygenase [Loktanella sp. SALINAS62]
MIPRIDAAALIDPTHDGHAAARRAASDAASGVGFLTVYNTGLTSARVQEVIDAYRRFFHLPASAKQAVDMARTGSNRGWGASGSEQVNPDANPDYKQVFDCGVSLPADHPLRLAGIGAYAPNQWPDMPADFAPVLRRYFIDACTVARNLLVAVLESVGEDGAFFADKFGTPMALLRGNFYPERPTDAGARDFGIATHTDYGCLTLLATDGSPGLEVRQRGGGWIPVSAPPGEFIINFGEMLEIWTAGRVKATPHRVIGTQHERISVPLFFNPDHDANVAPAGAPPVMAIDHLQKRFNDTYLHLKKA